VIALLILAGAYVGLLVHACVAHLRRVDLRRLPAEPAALPSAEPWCFICLAYKTGNLTCRGEGHTVDQAIEAMAILNDEGRDF